MWSTPVKGQQRGREYSSVSAPKQINQSADTHLSINKNISLTEQKEPYVVP
jgi:hypothetical protein